VRSTPTRNAFRPFRDAAVANAFAAYPSGMRRKLLVLRELIFDTAAGIDGVGEIDEALRWGEPAYLTSQSGSGSTIRVGWKKSSPSQYAMYFHCQTTLVQTFRTLFPRDFRYEGNRAIVFGEADVVPVGALSFCVAAALTHHRQKIRR
jgi:Domain of unknown function (DU1801)